MRTSSVLLNGATLFSTDDYPAASLRSGNEGRVRYIVSVSASGTPIDCRITSSSGHALLDSTTCRLVRQRARFRPAVNIVGRATADNYLGSVEWKLPD
ncbi:MAG: energy transducer TonB [Sphingomonas sp.]